MRRKVFCFIDYFHPAKNAGGIVTSVNSLMVHLAQFHEVHVFTRNHDQGSEQPFNELEMQRTQAKSPFKIHYFKGDASSRAEMLSHLRSLMTGDDLVYFNSFFSPEFTWFPLRAIFQGQWPRQRLLIAPRGELLPAARHQKWLKKWVYLKVFKALGYHQNILFQSGGAEEKREIQSVFGLIRVRNSNDLPPLIPKKTIDVKPPNNRPKRLLFVGRVAPIKNVSLILQALNEVPFAFRLDICGPIEDEAYWKDCQKHLAKVRDGCEVHHHDSKTLDELADFYQQADLLVLPSKSESFGNVIFESLAYGCPCLIGPNTPWKHLRQAKAGDHVESLSAQALKRKLIDLMDEISAAPMDWRQGANQHAWDYYEKAFKDPELSKMFLLND